MSMFMIMLILSGIPFIVIQCMPGKKSFIILAVVYSVLMTYGYYDNHKPLVNDLGDGPGAVFGMIFFNLICYGAIAGIIIKFITLYTQFKNLSFTKRIVFICFGATLIPIFLYQPVLYQKWKYRPPGPDCNYDIVNFTISGQNFRVPGLGIVTANTGNGKDHADDLTKFFTFSGNPSFRQFCSEFNNGKTHARVNAVNINFSSIAREQIDTRFSSVCQKAHWPNDVCQFKGYDTPTGYPSHIGIYDKTKFNPGFMGGGWDSRSVQDDIKKAHQISDIPDFYFDGFNYFWIDKNQNNKDSETFALSCHQNNDKLYCQHDETWSDNVSITYSMIVSRENPIEEARKIRQNVVKFISSLQQPVEKE